jgi:hypothetical protein
VARAEAVITQSEEAIRQRRHVRLGSGLVAVVLVAAAVVLFVRRPGEPRSAKAFCSRITAAKDLSSVLASGDAAQIRAAVATFDRAAAVAPKEIEPQVDVMAHYADGLVRALSGTGDPDRALANAVRAQEDQIPKVELAGLAVSSYTQSTCGLTLDQSGGESTPTSPTGPSVPG